MLIRFEKCATERRLRLKIEIKFRIYFTAVKCVENS